MDFFIALLFWLLLLGAFIFVLLMGQSVYFRNGPVGKAHSFLTDRLPTLFCIGARRALGQRFLNRVEKIWFYCCESRNPILQIFYLTLNTGSFALFIYDLFPQIPNPYLSRVHVITVPLVMASTYITFYKACTTNPGRITKQNVQRLNEFYPYDNLIFHPKMCTTCGLQKPARSKHCTACGYCVARSDHHCAWINGCVGARNHRHFLFFLGSLWVTCGYGSYLLFQLTRHRIDFHGLRKAWISGPQGKKYPLDLRHYAIFLIANDRTLTALLILATVLMLVLTVFIAYQLYLVARGMTTNEAFKWEDLELQILSGEVWVSEVVEPQIEVKVETGKKKQRKNAYDHHQQNNEQPERRDRQIKSLAEVANIYDRGIWANLSEVLWPPEI